MKYFHNIQNWYARHGYEHAAAATSAIIWQLGELGAEKLWSKLQQLK